MAKFFSFWTVSTVARGSCEKRRNILVQIKSPPSLCRNTASEGEGGAGGIRTLVQTRKQTAFYMFSNKLIFVSNTACCRQIAAYFLWFPLLHRNIAILVFPLPHLLTTCRKTRPVRDVPSRTIVHDEANQR